MDWAEDEFRDLDLGDERLNRRWCKLTSAIYSHPMNSIQKSCESWGDTKAAYRLFSNDKVDKEKILEVHRRRTIRRIRDSEEIILAIQDSSGISFNPDVRREDLGLMKSAEGKDDLLLHTTLACTASGLPLGILDQQIIKRKKSKGKRGCFYQLPTNKKETYRWIKATESTFSCLLDRKVIFVGDREADMFELLLFHADMGQNFLVRSSADRVVGERAKVRKGQSRENEVLSEFLASQEVRGETEITFYDGKIKKERSAILKIKFAKIIIPAPYGLYPQANHPSIKVFAIEAKEEKPPKGCLAVHWKLLTSLDVSTLSQALEKIEWYKQRWTIEIFHKVLKSGYQIEKMRLTKLNRIEKFMTLISIVSWRLLWMTRVQKISPNLPCSAVFERAEWKTLFMVTENKSYSSPPPLQNAIRQMAKLGGFLGRKSDGEPGVQSIWHGWLKLHEMTRGYRAATCG